MRRFLIVLGVVLAVSAAIYGAGRAFIDRLERDLTRVDPFPTFMADYETRQAAARSQDEAARSFSEFVGQTFPTGSDAKDAIAQITQGGFAVTTSSSESVKLFWSRQGRGFCGETYTIIIGQSADGRIAKITGSRRAVCL